ncbi:MAG: acetate kinase, partial [Phycisphaerae bacterium]
PLVEYEGPFLLWMGLMTFIEHLFALAPMENPYALAGIDACRKLLGGVPQVGVFDTSFFLKMPAAACCLAWRRTRPGHRGRKPRVGKQAA